MKKLAALLMLLCLLACSMPALADEAPGLSAINATDTYEAKVTRKIRFMGEGLLDHYYIMQGAATDGEYGYFIVESRAETLCSIVKIDLNTWKIVDRVYELPVDHGNSMAYNARLDQFIIVHCKPTRNRLSFVDRETLTVVSTLDMPIDMCSISYNELRDQYVIGHYDNRHFSICDSGFNILTTLDTQEGTFNNQGSDCDDQYIYLIEWDKSKLNSNHIIVYDWYGNYVNQVTVKSMNEIESMFHTEDKLVITFFAQQADVYEAEIVVK